MDKALLIEKSWQSYRNEVIPEATSATQVIECRRAFYAGAQGLFTTILTILEPGAEPTDGDLETMNSIAAELKRFVDQVKVGIK